MKASLIVSRKGQITLPAAMRRELGIVGNAVVNAEQQGGRIVLTPAIVVETEYYSEADIANWTREDRFADGERANLTAKLKRQAKRKPLTKPKPNANVEPKTKRAAPRRA